MWPKFRSSLVDYVLITVGALALAVNINLFLAPNNLAPGGVSGTSIIINEFTGWPIGLTMLVLNVPLVVLGFRTLGGFRFLSRTLYAVLVYNLSTDLMARWLAGVTVTDDLILNALFGGVLAGLASGLVYRGGGTTAGTGILGRVLQMRTGIPVSQIYLLVDGSVVFVAGLVFGWERALYALITLFVWGLATDYVLEGPSVVRTVFIVTDRPEDVGRAILERLHIGVTSWPAEGMFTRAQHTILFCTLSRPQEPDLRRVVNEIDPEAFLVTGHGHQASGGVFGPPRRARHRRSGKEQQVEIALPQGEGEE
ncbi:MAG: YitT family protein [Anaerolineae bacterium]|jgi:uncharacterized membrane-anchored protein YitT (DUF2179 family)